MNEALASPKGGEVGEGLGLMVALRWQDRHNASQSTTTGPEKQDKGVKDLDKKPKQRYKINL